MMPNAANPRCIREVNLSIFDGVGSNLHFCCKVMLSRADQSAKVCTFSSQERLIRAERRTAVYSPAGHVAFLGRPEEMQNCAQLFAG